MHAKRSAKCWASWRRAAMSHCENHPEDYDNYEPAIGEEPLGANLNAKRRERRGKRDHSRLCASKKFHRSIT